MAAKWEAEFMIMVLFLSRRIRRKISKVEALSKVETLSIYFCPEESGGWRFC